MASQETVVAAWKSRLNCGVCGKPLADERDLWIDSLPYPSSWAAPTVPVTYRNGVAVEGVRPRLVTKVCPCWGIGHNPDPEWSVKGGVARRHVAVFLCREDAERADRNYRWLVEEVRDGMHIVRVSVVPRFEPAAENPKYHPARSRLTYVSVAALEDTFVDVFGRKVPSSTSPPLARRSTGSP